MHAMDSDTVRPTFLIDRDPLGTRVNGSHPNL